MMQQQQQQQLQSKSPSGPSRRALAAVAVVCFSVAGVYVASDSLAPHGDDGRSRQLSVALPRGGCRVTYAQLSTAPIPPTWQASFPGSGSRMTWNIIEALTGIRTNDDYDSHARGYERVVAVKTHYPVKYARRGPKGAKVGFNQLDELFGRAIVVLRNPMNAVPSYFNLQYEHLKHLPNHSTRGPNKDWLRYRDDPNSGLAVQLANYEKFVEYWMEKYPRRQIFLLSYEDLTDDLVGPLAAGSLAGFLGEVEGVDPVAPEAVLCVWETIVNYKNAKQPPKGRARPPPVEEVRAGSEKRRRKARHENSNENAGGGRADTNERKRRTAGPRASRRKLEARVSRHGKTHADPSSLRVGPKKRAYTAQNLADMVALFRRLEGKYDHDEEFVRIMRSYIEAVTNTVPVEIPPFGL